MANSNKIANSISIHTEIEQALNRLDFWSDRFELTNSAAALEAVQFWNKQVDRLESLLPPIKAKSLIDYTPKKSDVDDWDNEPIFGQQAPKQELDLEDTFVSVEKIKSLNIDAYFEKACHFKFKNSKSKSKWARIGKAARVLSNRQ